MSEYVTHSRLRIFFWGFVLGALLLVVFFRLVYLQLTQVAESQEQLPVYRSYDQSRSPVRGTIYDTNENVLAIVGYEFDVGLTIDWLPTDDLAYTQLLDEIAANLNVVDPEKFKNDLKQTLDSNVDAKGNTTVKYYPVATRVSLETKQRLEKLQSSTAIQFDEKQRREYPNKELMCHVMGSVQIDGEGSSGLELHYNSELGGQAYVQPLNRVPVPYESKESVASRDLVLTVDRGVQALVEQHLKEAITEYGATGGTIIATNPQTGEIIAMASDDCYHPKDYQKLSAERFEYIGSLTDEQAKDFEDNTLEYSRLVNPAISVPYEPGSTFKLLTYAAALDTGVATPNDYFTDPGTIQVGGITVNNASGYYYGTIPIKDSLIFSINTAPSTYALNMGADVFHQYLTRFGIGKPTGIDLAAEESGLFEASPINWTLSGLATASYGQGIGVTPIQLTTAVGAIANGGRMMQPYIVDKILQNGIVTTDNQPTEIGRPIREQVAKDIIDMAIAVAEHNDVVMDGYTIAGKTGTAQVYIGNEYHFSRTMHSFIGWLPAHNPELLMLVKLNEPTKREWGSETASPTFTKLANEMVIALGIPPDKQEAEP